MEYEVVMQLPEEDPPGEGWEPFSAQAIDLEWKGSPEPYEYDGHWSGESVVWWRKPKEPE